MSALCCRSFRSNGCLVPEYKGPNFLGSQEWETFQGHPVLYLLKGSIAKDPVDLLSSVKPVLTRISPSPVLVIEWTNLDLNGSLSSF